MIRKSAITLALLLAMPSPLPAADESCVEVTQATGFQFGKDDVRVVGELVSRCDRNVSVELKATVRDENGRVVGVEEWWPSRPGEVKPGRPSHSGISCASPCPGRRSAWKSCR
jgi:hypothetical protein